MTFIVGCLILAAVLYHFYDTNREQVQALTDFGYDYCLTMIVTPLSEEGKRISFSKEKLTDPVTYTFEFGGCTFYLAVTPKDGWRHGWKILPNLILGFFIILFLTGLVIVILVIEFHRETLKKIAITDPKNVHCVGIQTDIDDFKFINDMYGHEAGDTALRILAQSMRNAFEKDAILCRNGGDEFSAVLIGMTEAEVKEKIEKFTLQPRYITQNGEKHPFYISLGYAEYPKDCDDVSELISCADMALYAVKLHGKHSCCAYDGNYKVQYRSQLGFTLQDVSRNLTGAFLTLRIKWMTASYLPISS